MVGGGSPTHGNSTKQKLTKRQDMITFVDLDIQLLTNQDIYIYIYIYIYVQSSRSIDKACRGEARRGGAAWRGTVRRRSAHGATGRGEAGRGGMMFAKNPS